MHVHMTGKGGVLLSREKAWQPQRHSSSEKAQSSTVSTQRIPRFLTFDEAWKMRIFHVKQN